MQANCAGQTESMYIYTHCLPYSPGEKIFLLLQFPSGGETDINLRIMQIKNNYNWSKKVV